MSVTSNRNSVKSTHGADTHATKLGAVLRSALRSLAYAPTAIREAMAFIEDNGQAGGCESIDPADVEMLDQIIIDGTQYHEFADASEWPSIYDAFVWEDDPTTYQNQLPRSNNLCSNNGPSDAGEPYEPTRAESVWHSSLGTVNLFDPIRDNDLVLMPISGGAPCPDARPVKLVGRRAREIHPAPKFNDRDRQRSGAL